MISSYLLALVYISVTNGYDYYYDQQPLFVSPLLDAGKDKEARDLALNKINDRTSYSGYFTVEKECGNHLFFWFFPALKDWESAAVLLWLNGGPGSTSMFGLFVEVGPWNFVKGKGLVVNEHAWTNEHNVIFIDQPVGTGFSFTEEGCYAEDLMASTEQLFRALRQFFLMFPMLNKNAFYLTGESYAGHYLPALAVKIDQANQKATVKIQLAGLLMGNAYVDMRCDDSSGIMHELGVLDYVTYRYSLNNHAAIVGALLQEDFKKAASLIQWPVSHLPNYYHISYDEKNPSLLNDYKLFIRDIKNRDSLHVGYTPFVRSSSAVYTNLYEDIPRSQVESLDYLLLKGTYVVVFYTGQLDTICPPSSVACTVHQLRWPGAYDFYNAKPSICVLYIEKCLRKVGSRVAAWFKSVGPLMELVVRNAGHFAPTDQGEFVLTMLNAVIRNTRKNVEQTSSVPDNATLPDNH